jgi:diaminopimelate epimerase
MSMNAPFAKMNGIGNQIAVADMRGRVDLVSASAAVALNEHVPFDQLMAIHDPQTNGTDALVHILNSDGSTAGACGNGMRCVTLYLADAPTAFIFETNAGLLPAAIDGARISIGMGAPLFGWQEIPVAREVADTDLVDLNFGPAEAPLIRGASLANMGNPHAVFWAEQPLEAYPLQEFGPQVEHDPLFPDRVNVSLARVVSRTEINLRTWERGAGLTQACGSAACAAAVCGARTGRTERQVTVNLPGGSLYIDWREDGVMMSGAAEHEFNGRFDPATGAVELTA